jgi:hypothetical protein
MKALLFILTTFCYVNAALYDVIADEARSSRRTTNMDIVRRQLQTDNDIVCTARSHGEAISCVETTVSNDIITYSVTCPPGAAVVEDCLQDQKRICYQFNALPCVGGFYCLANNIFALDCGTFNLKLQNLNVSNIT